MLVGDAIRNFGIFSFLSKLEGILIDCSSLAFRKYILQFPIAL